MQLLITCNGEHINTHCPDLGRCTDRLSDKGILESLRLAHRLKDQHFDFIFCSDFGFRRTSTDLIVEALRHKQFQIIVDPNMREKDAEICTQLTKDTLIKHSENNPEDSSILSRLFIKNDHLPSHTTTNETQEQVLARAKQVIYDLLHHYPSEAHILLVGNPIINSFLISILLGKKDYLGRITSPCSLSSYRSVQERWIEESFNMREHLYGNSSF
ncbi:MAG: histidine phosphatase family protein [bacterium]|nr:histidine phosphatase family protein [bacterium]